jgi:hypothetical protein
MTNTVTSRLGSMLVLLSALLASCRSCPPSGWLLMEPPVVERDGRHTVSSLASVHFWRQAEAYDTAAACEEARRSRAGQAEPAVGEAPQASDAAEAQAQALSYARCVPTGAVYLESGERRGRGRRPDSPP